MIKEWKCDETVMNKLENWNYQYLTMLFTATIEISQVESTNRNIVFVFNWARLVQNGTNLRRFKIRFVNFAWWAKLIFKKIPPLSQFVPIWHEWRLDLTLLSTYSSLDNQQGNLAYLLLVFQTYFIQEFCLFMHFH